MKANILHESLNTPSNGMITITDTKGRVLMLSTPGPLAFYKLIEALGETAKNQVYLSMVIPILFVQSIDDNPVTSPTTKSEVEAIIETLGDHGLFAVMKGLQEHFSSGANPIPKM